MVPGGARLEAGELREAAEPRALEVHAVLVARRRQHPVVAHVGAERDAGQARGRAVLEELAEDQARRGHVGVRVDLAVGERIAQEAAVQVRLVERTAERQVEAGGLLVEVLVREVRAIGARRERVLRIEEPAVREGGVEAIALAADVGGEAQAVAPAEQVVLRDAARQHEGVLRRVARAEGERTGRLLDHADVEVDLVRLIGLLLLEVHLLEEAERVEPLLGVADRARRVELALDELHLATDHAVDGAGIPRDVDVAHELERSAHDVEGDVHRLGGLVGARLRLDLGEGEAAIRVVPRHPLDVLGEVGAVEPLVLRERELVAHDVLLHGVVAGEVEAADLEALALGERHGHDDAVVDRRDLRLADFGAQVAGVSVLLLDALEILHEDGFGVGAGLVEVLGRVGPPVPGLGLHALGQLAVVEVFVALELDLAELQLLALDHLEVHRHRVVRQRLDLVVDRCLVVAFGAVQGLDAVAVLVEQRQVERGAGGERQLIADAIALDRLVAGDRHLAHHRVLDDVEGEDAPVRARLRVDAHVLEEAQRVDLAHVLGDLRGVEAIARLGRDAGADRVGLDALVAGDADLVDAFARLHRRDAGAHQAIGRNQPEHHGHAVGAALGRGGRGADAGHRLQLLEVGLQRVTVVGPPRLRAQLAAHARFVELRRPLEAHRCDAPRHRRFARHDLDHAVRELADAVEQLRIAVRREHHGARRDALARRRDAHVEAVGTGELGDAALHHPIGADFLGELAQHLVGALACDVGDQRLAHHDGVDHFDLAARFESLGELVGDRGLEVGERARAVHLERQHRHQHLDGTGSRPGGRGRLCTRCRCGCGERQNQREPSEARPPESALGAQSLPPVMQLETWVRGEVDRRRIVGAGFSLGNPERLCFFKP